MCALHCIDVSFIENFLDGLGDYDVYAKFQWKNDFGLATAGIREFLRFSRSLIKWKRLELSPLNGERAYLAVKGGRDEWISESDWKIYLGNDLELLQTDTY